jgi:hypothetical protein
VIAEAGIGSNPTGPDVQDGFFTHMPSMSAGMAKITGTGQASFAFHEPLCMANLGFLIT